MNSPTDYAAALLRKAHDDAYVVEHLAADAAAPDWVLGFHAQQAAEKAIKAVLAKRNIEFPRTHNLAMLLELLRRDGSQLPPDSEDLPRLVPFGVALRYDDALGADEPALDRKWAVQVVTRTLLWADQ